VKKLLALGDHNTDKHDIEYVSSVDGVMDLCYGTGEKGEKGEKIEYGTLSQFSSCKFNDIWIIGGSSVYQEFIHRDLIPGLNVCNNTTTNITISNYYITYIDKEYECDTYFPMLENMNKYHLTQFEKHECVDKNTRDASPLNVYYIVFKKIKYTDEKRIEELFTPYRYNNGSNSSNGSNGSKNIERDLLFYIKKTKIGLSLSLCSNELEILFSMFSS
jgi:hypothetical protein